MNYFFLFLSIFCSAGLFAGSFGSKPSENNDSQESVNPQYKEARTIVQLLPIKGNINKKNSVLKEQLIKMAIRHISLIDKYELAFGKALPRVNGDTKIENVEVTLLNKGRDNYRLELRVFELERNTLVKKVAQSKLSENKLLQQAELMFQELFLESVVIPE